MNKQASRSMIMLISAIVTLVISSVYTLTGEALSAYADEITGQAKVSAQLKVEGNRVVNAKSGEAVRLTGVNVPSLEWTASGEHVYTSVAEAYDNWNANVIRLPLSSARWFGLTKEQAGKGAEPYQKMVAEVVKAAEERGKYVILDCHWSDAGQTEELKKAENINTDLVNNTTGQHKMPDAGVKEFWLDIAAAYGNHSAVLFNLYNEPYGVSWEIWRNGGSVNDTAAGKNVTYTAVGHQELVEAIRDAGAKNIIVAGGLDYAYSLTGIAGKAKNDTKVYALADTGSGGDAAKSGYGIIYDTHIYPWKYGSDKWETAVGCSLDKYPVIVGENGWEKQIIEGSPHNLSMLKNPKLDSPYWVNELLNWIDHPTNDKGEETNVPLNWTAWTFHPSAQPTTFSSWYYEPTPFWGKYLKKRLLSYPSVQAEAKNYINSFTSENDWVARYVDANGKTPGYGSLTARTYEDGAVKLKYDGNGSEIRMEPLPMICFKGIQSLHVTLNPSVSGRARVGIAETDGELWTKELDLTAGVQNRISIPISEFTLTPFEGADGIFTGVAASVYIKPAGQRGELRVSNLVINRGGDNMGGYPIPGGEQGQSLEYVHQDDVILNGEAQTVPFPGLTSGTNLLHFLGRGAGHVTLSLRSSGREYETEAALGGTDSWKHIVLSPGDFEGLADFSDISGLKVSGSAGALLRHITFTHTKPPEYRPNEENTVDYCVSFEADGDQFYKQEFDPKCIEVSEAIENENTFLKFAVKNSGDLMLRFNPDNVQENINLRNAKTLSFDLKGDGGYANIKMGILGKKMTIRIPIILTDSNWHRITLDLEEAGVYIPQFMTGIKFYMSGFAGRSFMLDNVSVSSEAASAPDEKIAESFDSGEALFRWSGGTAAEGHVGNGYSLALGSQPAAATLNRDSLQYWQRDLSGMRYLSFLAKTNTPKQPVSVVLQESGGTVLASYQFILNTNHWERVEIPLLAGCEALKTNDIARIVWDSDAECEISLDELCLDKNQPAPSVLPRAEIISDSVLILHDDFESDIEVERTAGALTVKEDGVPGWEARGSDEAISNFGLFKHEDNFNRTGSLSTASKDEIYTLQYNSGNQTTLYRDFTRPGSDGMTAVEMRLRYPAYGENTVSLYEKSAADMNDNLAIARITFDANGNLTYKDEYMGNTAKTSTVSQTTAQEGGWIYLRAVVNSTDKTVRLYAGHNFETLLPWTENKDTFNFAANNTSSPYVQAGSSFGSVAISGKGTASLDDVRIYHQAGVMLPEASDVKISGIPRAGETLTAAYTFYDPQDGAEGDSFGIWESAADREFTVDVKTLAEKSGVSSKTGDAYLVTDQEAGRYIRFSIFPKRAGDETPGDAARAVSAKVGAIDVVKAVFTKDGKDASVDGIGISGSAGGRAYVTNTTEESGTISFYIAAYDIESGVLTDAALSTADISANTAGPVPLNAEEFAVKDNNSYKLFVWDERQRPYIDCVNAITSVTDLKQIIKEDFAEADGTDLCRQTANADSGWASGWKTTKKIDNVSTVIDIPENTYTVRNGYMTTVHPQYGGAGGYGFSIFRELTDESAIRLDEDAEYFIKYTIPEVQYLVTASHNYQNQTLAFYTGTKSKFSVGIKRKDDSSNYMVFHTNFSGAPAEYKIENGSRYTFVIRISTKASGADVCRIKLFKDEEETWFPLSWDYEAYAPKNDVIDALALTLSNHASVKVYPQFDDINVYKCAPIYVSRNSEIGLMSGEALKITIPQTNVYGHPQTLDMVEWFAVKDGRHICIGTGEAFTVPSKETAELIRARVTLTDLNTGKKSSIWAISDVIN